MLIRPGTLNHAKFRYLSIYLSIDLSIYLYIYIHTHTYM